MKKISSNKILIFSLLLIGLVGMVSAENVNNYVTTQVTIGQHETAVQFQLVNPAGQSYDSQKVSFSVSSGQLVITDPNMPTFLNDLLSSYDFSSILGTMTGTGTLSFKVSDIINGVNFTTNIADGTTSPTFSNVNIDGTISFSITLDGFPGIITVSLNDLLTSAGISNVQTFLNELAQSNPSPIQMVGDASFTKIGNTITITYNKGYAEAQQNFPGDIAYVQSVIGAFQYWSGNVQNLIDLSEFDLSSIPSVYQDLIDTNQGISASIDLTSLGTSLHDGTYHILVTLNDNTATVDLILQGFPVEDDTTPETPHSDGGGDHYTINNDENDEFEDNSINNPITNLGNIDNNPTPINLSPITGGVIGTFLKSGAGIATLTVLIATALGGIAYFGIKRRK